MAKENTNEEYVLNYLSDLVDKNKTLPPKQRLENYIKHFVDIGRYDKQRRDAIVGGSVEESLDLSEKELREFLQTGDGVCQQFAQALSLIGVIDGDMNIFYSACNLLNKEGKKIGHALNVVIMDGNAFVVDLSSLIHCKEKDYKSSPQNFYNVKLEEYIENLKKEGVELISFNKDEKGEYDHYLATLKLLGKENLDAYYLLINLPASEINEKYSNFVYDIWPIEREKQVETNEERNV